ncbi:MAG: sulfite exporter TauE/SafE family protein [Bacteroidales bacterium]|nr:sulfite exporter TauE/SafE family protein [Bacteroidales bacterium]
MSCDDEKCLPPKESDFEFVIQGASLTIVIPEGQSTTSIKEQKKSEDEFFKPQVDLSGEASKQSDKIALQSSETSEKSGKPLWGFFLFSMLAGFAGLLTPCVFPMIPMTVAFFSQRIENRVKSILKAIIFGLSIILIYTSIGLIVSLTSAGADFANNLSTHWIPNVIFFTLFMIFAASFLGMFELELPSRLINSSDKQVDRGGIIASFFMGVTTVLVSFSCTGPIVGALLVEAASGDVIKPTLGMFGFSLAFALPFTLFAIFPSWLKNLPKSGGWLNSVKVILGFIVLAFGLKFLSNIDQTYHLGILSRQIYLAIWIVIFTIMGFYLLGKIKFAHDSDLPFITIPRLVLIIATFVFVLYLVPGLFGAPLNSISGLIPPQDPQGFKMSSQVTGSSLGISNASDNGSNTLCEAPKYADFLHLPYGLKGYFDYDQGLACARKLNKPVFLDFKGHACSNCKEMESKVWSDPEVLKRLKNEFIIITLYVDDRTKLDESDWVVSEYDGKVKKTLGKKNSDFQITRYKINSQPYYVILDLNENVLVLPRSHNLDIKKYVDFLDEGLEEFKKLN